jgi:hypothetical protein
MLIAAAALARLSRMSSLLDLDLDLDRMGPTDDRFRQHGFRYAATERPPLIGRNLSDDLDLLPRRVEADPVFSENIWPVRDIRLPRAAIRPLLKESPNCSLHFGLQSRCRRARLPSAGQPRRGRRLGTSNAHKGGDSRA